MRRIVVSPAVAAAASLGVALAIAACKRDGSGPGSGAPAAAHDTEPVDQQLAAITRLDDGSLFDRAMRLGLCSTMEGVPCADDYSAELRCELALRAQGRAALHERLLGEARSSDRVRRGAALRVITDFHDETSVTLGHQALLDPDDAVACAAARYGTWFLRDDAPRLAVLEQRCDGKAIIAVTRAAVEKAEAGQIAKGGVTCAELRAPAAP